MSGQINTNINSRVISLVSNVEIHQQLEKYFEMEEIEEQRPQSEENAYCEEHFLRTHKRNNNGTYTVAISFKQPIHPLGESKAKAAARLLQLEKRFLTDNRLETDYTKFMFEYLDLEHMTLAAPIPHNAIAYYIPHQAVIKMDSTTTKLRVVFDASCKTTNGQSLNSTMYIGPKLQNDLSQILLRWRKYQFVFTADVEKMYRQIHIREEDQIYHRVLWRWNQSEPIQEYQMTTVTFGVAAALYLAIRTLQQLAVDERNNFPKAAETVLHDFYVDELMSGDTNLF